MHKLAAIVKWEYSVLHLLNGMCTQGKAQHTHTGAQSMQSVHIDETVMMEKVLHENETKAHQFIRANRNDPNSHQAITIESD